MFLSKTSKESVVTFVNRAQGMLNPPPSLEIKYMELPWNLLVYQASYKHYWTSSDHYKQLPINCRRRNEQEVTIMQYSHPTAPPRPTSRNTHTMSHSVAHANLSSHQTPHHLSIARFEKNEKSANTDSSTNDDQEDATDGEDQSIATNHLSNTKPHCSVFIKNPSSPDSTRWCRAKNPTIHLCRIATIDCQIVPPLI